MLIKNEFQKILLMGILVGVVISFIGIGAFKIFPGILSQNPESGDGLAFIKKEAEKAAGGQTTKEGKQAPDFSLTTIDGDEITLQSFSGKPLLLEVMATWCGICISETPAFRSALDEFKDLSVLSVNIDPTETVDDINRFRRAYADDYDSWYFAQDTDQFVVKYGAPFTGTTILVDGNGQIVYRDSYSTKYETIREELLKLGEASGGLQLSSSEETGLVTQEQLQKYNLSLADEINKLKEIYGNQGYRILDLDIEGLYCPSCPLIITNQLLQNDGVIDVKISFYESKGAVVYDPKRISGESIANDPIFSPTSEGGTGYEAKIVRDIDIQQTDN